MIPRKQTDGLNDLVLHYLNVRYLIFENNEFITPNELYDMGITLCSDCGKESPQDFRQCPRCGTIKMVLKESTVREIAELKEHYSFYNSKRKAMVLGFLKGFYVDGKRKPTNFEEKINKGEKLHTIRWDANDRWLPGRKIHFATGARTTKYNCFKEGNCISTQKIVIEEQHVFIDGTELTEDQIEYLSINDGFDSLEDFWEWFGQYTPFTGKIIHWTDLYY